MIKFYEYVPYIVGFIYPIFVGTIFIKNIMLELKEEVRFSTFGFSNKEKNAYNWYVQIIGILELILYIVAMLIDKYEFIAIWLAFKVAGRWESSKLEKDYHGEMIKKTMEKKKKSMQLIINNALYNTFTIGNVLVIIWAFASYKIIIYMQGKDIIKFVLMSCSILVGTLIIYIFAKRQTIRLRGIDKK